MNALDFLRKAKEVLAHSGIEAMEQEAELIISHCLGVDRATLYRDNPELSEDTCIRIHEVLARRSKREPLQYIIGSVEFYGLKIKVGPGVLIPRPETELLAEEAIRILYRQKSSHSPLTERGQGVIRILDLCTGSGCIALALARAFPDAEVYGTDTSGIAIRYAEENARINGVKTVTFLRGSLFEPIQELITTRHSLLTADLIISNPPYIRRDELQRLQAEIRDWEPLEALNGGEDGIEYYRFIIVGAGEYLRERAHLILEIGIGQADAVHTIARDAGFSDISFIKDYAGIDRVMILKKE